MSNYSLVTDSTRINTHFKESVDGTNADDDIRGFSEESSCCAEANCTVTTTNDKVAATVVESVRDSYSG